MANKIKNKHLDLLAAYNRKDGPSTVSKGFRLVVVPAVLVGVFVIFFAVMTFMTMGKNSELNTAKEDIEVVQLKIESTDKNPYEELQSLQSIYQSLESLDESLSNLSTLTKEKINYLKTDLLTGIELSSITFDRNSNLLTVNLKSSNVQNIEKYVTKLKTHAEYVDIAYTGYQKTEASGVDTSGIVDENGNPLASIQTPAYYSFIVKITLEGKAGE